MGNKDTYPIHDQWGNVSLIIDKKMVFKINGISDRGSACTYSPRVNFHYGGSKNGHLFKGQGTSGQRHSN